MSSQLRPLIIIIVLIGALLYIGGIVWAGVMSLSADETNPANVPALVTHIITAIGATLGTHFGALFGISQFNGDNPRPIPNPLQVNVWATLPSRKSRGEIAGLEEGARKFDRFQVLAGYVYFLSLLLALGFWLITGFSPYAAEPIQNMASALVGVIVGVATVVLNVRPDNGN